MTDSVISLENVTKIYGKNTVLSNVSISFAKNKIHGIIGRNGSGKTMLLKCICGLTIKTTGKIIVNGKEIGKDTDIAPNVGIIIEAPGFLPNYTGYHNLKFLADINGIVSKEQIKAAIKRVGLDPDSKKKVSQYSLGMRQRLGIAQAIMEKPSILLLDEPLNGIDKHGIEDIRELFLQLRNEGTTIVLASHNKEDIELLCDTVCEMDNGMIVVQNADN